jgi:hypothetical protein
VPRALQGRQTTLRRNRGAIELRVGIFEAAQHKIGARLHQGIEGEE